MSSRRSCYSFLIFFASNECHQDILVIPSLFSLLLMNVVKTFLLFLPCFFFASNECRQDVLVISSLLYSKWTPPRHSLLFLLMNVIKTFIVVACFPSLPNDHYWIVCLFVPSSERSVSNHLFDPWYLFYIYLINLLLLPCSEWLLLDRLFASYLSSSSSSSVLLGVDQCSE